MTALPASSPSSVSEPSSSTSGSTALRPDAIGPVGLTATVVSAAMEMKRRVRTMAAGDESLNVSRILLTLLTRR